MNLLSTIFQNIREAGPAVFFSAGVFISLIISAVSYYLLKFILRKFIYGIIRKTKSLWDDLILNRKTLEKLIRIFPVIIFYYIQKALLLSGGYNVPDFLKRATASLIIFISLLFAHSVFDVLGDIYKTFPISKKRPVKGYIQLIKMFLSAGAIILAAAVLLGKSPLLLFSGIGAATAVIMLIFKDTILGFVSSVQISANDMVRIGDWIEMPKYGADGDVIDISLHTVKVQNWDKTVVTVPSYAMVSDAFKNWRGMQESGGRRIKRAVNIDMNTIRFLENEDIESMKEIESIRNYLEKKKIEIDRHNREKGHDGQIPVNGRRLTNIGTFRAYVKYYLRSHTGIKQDMAFLVRQLSPTEHGLPLEIYVFSADTSWAAYEDLQADIFDHILACVNVFGLRVFQSPSGNDVSEALKK
ncbi:MAG: mechanosensitive ion channel family protein [Fibrobacterota bacterium]